MILGLAELWYLNEPEVQNVFLKAGQLIYDAGPLHKPWGLCHGTAGNGYALLKLFTLTQDEKWLEQARRFAMHAMKQSQQAEKVYGMIRSDAWCGDLGLLLYLQSCIEVNSEFPMLESL